jgi:phosphotransacetylase
MRTSCGSTGHPESQKIAGLVSFFNEKVDVYVDGELQERPRTKFSK